MDLPDKQMDILHAIESSIVDLYRNYPQLKDKEVRKALEKLIKRFRALATGRAVIEPKCSSEIEEVLFRNIETALEVKRSSMGGSPSEKPKSLFGRKSKQATPDEFFLASLRKVEKSVGKWTKRGGEQGYLNFIQGYVE